MGPDDLDRVVMIQEEGAVVALGHIFPQDAHPFPRVEIRQRWARELTDLDVRCFVILGADEAIQGFAAIRSNEFLHFGTARSTWGSGLAGRAHDDLLDHLREQGHLRIWLRVFEGNGRARRFYENRKWMMTGERTRSGFPPHPILLRYEREVAVPTPSFPEGDTVPTGEMKW